MHSIQDQLYFLKCECDILKANLKNVIFKIKEEMSAKYYTKNLEDIFRFTIMLFYGSYYTKYGLGNKLPNQLNISRAKVWKTNDLLNYFHIYKKYDDVFSYKSTSELVGFICYKKDLLETLCFNSELFTKIWVQYISDSYNKYNKGEVTFKQECLENKLDIYQIFKNYLTNKDILTIINCKQLQIKDVVLYIKN